jgi:hypothetical protein
LGATTHVATTPAQLVRVPSGYTLHYLITVTNAPATLVSLLPGGVMPLIPVPNVSGPAGATYKFLFVDAFSEQDPSAAEVRYTVDGQATPAVGVSPLGYVLVGKPSITRIPANPEDISFVANVASVKVNIYLGIGGSI